MGQARQNLALYVIKALRLMLVYYSLSVATQLFERSYIEKVYGKGEEPPPLSGIVIPVLASLVIFNFMVLAIAILVSTSSVGKDLVPPSTVQVIALDSFVHVGIVCFMAIVFGGLFGQKKYLQYKTQGPRAIRAFREIVVAAAVPVLIVPYFTPFGS